MPRLPNTAKVGSRGMQRAIIVAGMHRSGTSALTRVINLLGADLPSNLLGSNLSNALGHWESNDLIALHDEMLAAAGSSWNSLWDIAPSWFESASADAFVSRIGEFIRREFPTSPLFVIKDPRIALFVPIWQRALESCGVEYRVVLPFRSPVEVAASLSRRAAKEGRGEVWPIDRGVLLWLRYVLAAERATRTCPRAFVPFEHLLDGWRGEAARLERQLALAWPLDPEGAAEAINQFLSREHKNENLGVDATVLTPNETLALRVFAALARGVAAPHGEIAPFDEASATFAQAGALVAGYVEALESANEATRQALAVAHEDYQRWRETSEQETSRRIAAEARVSALEASTSWKLTKPLRYAVEKIQPRRH